ETCLTPSEAFSRLGTCPQPLLYPDRRHATAPLDLRFQSLLPARLRTLLEPFLNEEERTPQFFNLEDLLARILALRNIELPSAAGGGPDAQAWLNFVDSAEVILDLGELSDFFIPGMIDLGPSTASLSARWADGNASLNLA